MWLMILFSILFTLYKLQVYLKPHFNYNPTTDNLIPCKEAGLAFSKGDILQVVNKEDPNWWQVSRDILLSSGEHNIRRQKRKRCER